MRKLLARKTINGCSRNISKARVNIRKISSRDRMKAETVETGDVANDMNWLEYLKIGDLIDFLSKRKEMISAFLCTLKFFSPIFFILT